MKQDLFGEVSVTWDEIREWVRAVPKIDPDSAYGEYYIRAWNVKEKVRRAKENGTYDEIVGLNKPKGLESRSKFDRLGK